MPEATIEIVGPDQLAQVVDLFNTIFRPTRSIEAFQRRFQNRHNLLLMIARLPDRPVGFFMGFELKPTVFFAWFYGVLPGYRRRGIASRMMETAHVWAHEQGYRRIRLECFNQHRPLLHLCVELEYNVTGLRYDQDHGENLVIFEKQLGEPR